MGCLQVKILHNENQQLSGLKAAIYLNYLCLPLHTGCKTTLFIKVLQRVHNMPDMLG